MVFVDFYVGIARYTKLTRGIGVTTEKYMGYDLVLSSVEAASPDSNAPRSPSDR